MGFESSFISSVSFPEIRKEILENVERGMVRGGQVLIGAAYNKAKTIRVFSGGKIYVAWRTGELANSLGIAFSPVDSTRYGPMVRMGGDTIAAPGLPGARRGAIQVAIATTSGYGLYVHKGTSKVPSRPFILEAFLEKQGEILSAIRSSL